MLQNHRKQSNMKFSPYLWCVCVTLFFIEINAVPLKKNAGKLLKNSLILKKKKRTKETRCDLTCKSKFITEQ